MKIKLYVVEKFYYEIEMKDVEDFEDAQEKFYDDSQKIMQEQVPDRSDWNDYVIEVYDRDYQDWERT
jgi:hypothetical protein